MSEELEVLKEVARRLKQAAIPYDFTGSIAANFYTVPRMTRDIDIVVELFEQASADSFRSLKTTIIWSRKPSEKRSVTKGCSI